MSGPVRLRLPEDIDELRALGIGTEVELSGPVFTARDATHARLLEESRRTGALPYGLAGQVIFYAGPTPPAAGRPAGAIGPTTAARMDAWAPEFYRMGVAATLGKGPRSEEVARACRSTGSVYLACVGGMAALLATRVVSIEPVAYEELGPEALRRVVLDDFPAFVAIDAEGRDLFSAVRDRSGDG